MLPHFSQGTRNSDLKCPQVQFGLLQVHCDRLQEQRGNPQWLHSRGSQQASPHSHSAPHEIDFARP